MFRYSAAGIALLILLVEGACTREPDDDAEGRSSGGEHIAIAVSADCEDMITDAVPPSAYSFLVLADSAPTDIADLSERDLVICGTIGREQLLLLMIASDNRGTPLFRSAKHYFLSPNGSGKISEDVTYEFPAGGQVTYRHERRWMFGKDASVEQVLDSCMASFGGGEVLLLNRDLGVREPEALVRLVFGQ